MGVDEFADMAAMGFKEVTDTPAEPATETSTAAAEATTVTESSTTTTVAAEVAEPAFGKADATPPADVPVFNSKEWLNTDLSVDKIKEILTKYPELEKQFGELKNKNPFANDEVKAFNDAVSKNVSKEAFFKVYGVDVDKLTPLEKVVRQLMWSEGLTEDKAKMLVNHKYALDVVASEDMTETEKTNAEKTKQLAEVQLDMDARKATEFLSQFKKQTLDAPIVAEQESKADEVWKPHVPEILKDFETYKIGDFTYTMPKEALAEAQAAILDTLRYMKAEGLPTNAKDVEAVKKMAETTLKAREFDNVVKSLQAHYANKMIAFKNNPTPLESNADLKTRQNGTGDTNAMIKEIIEGNY